LIFGKSIKNGKKKACGLLNPHAAFLLVNPHSFLIQTFVNTGLLFPVVKMTLIRLSAPVKRILN